MGKKNRLRIEAIKRGEVQPIVPHKERIMTCRVCGRNDVPESSALAHVKECWGIEFTSVGLIPRFPPPIARMYHSKHLVGSEASNA